ncbi:ATP-binding cassette domain-containing protein [uncultured Microbacterium sp.]|uniref:ATP-binding cassette domain-containing protein n=1 Tax=uncultured Microbacterium sp. TaxID=191216 RepID=UPI0035CB659A
MTEPVVCVRGLTVDYKVEGELQRAVDRVDFDIAPGGALGLVGESGSGKSTIAFALARFLPAGALVHADQLTVAGEDVLGLNERALRKYRRTRIGFVYQEPGRALNPTRSVGSQVSETYRLQGVRARAAREATLAAFDDVGLPDPAQLVHRFPHELSGGQQQRVVIAMALATDPALLILDEPTTGLDSRIEAEVIALVDRLQRERGFATLLISHNLPLVAAHSERIGVLERGILVESGTAIDIVERPQHGYSKLLIDAVPSLEVQSRPVAATHAQPLLSARGVTKTYGGTVALDGVDLDIGRGEVLGLVGESGSGKTTLGRVIAGLTRSGGSIQLHTDESTRVPVQFVFQSPDASLNPRRTVRQTLTRSIELLHGETDAEELALSTGLAGDVLDKLPDELSGGQKQRVAIARAFAGRSPLVICDEPTSALDVSVQARVLDLLIELQERTGVSYLFITHDLAVVRRIAHRVAVLRHGRIVETGPITDVFDDAQHPYTESLLSAARDLRGEQRALAAA